MSKELIERLEYDIAFDEDEGCGSPTDGLPAEVAVPLSVISIRKAD